MHVILNLSAAKPGGALQAGVSFLNEALADDELEWEWTVFLSPYVADEVKRIKGIDRFAIRIFARSPARSFRARREVCSAVSEISPDAVLTIHGPTYVNLNAPHLMGCCLAWVSNPSLIAYRTQSFPFHWIRVFTKSLYMGYWLTKADAWWTETIASKAGMHRMLRIPKNKIEVFPNICGQHYFDFQTNDEIKDWSGPIRLVYLTAPREHKRLSYVPRVARKLRDLREGIEWKFITTLNPDSRICHQMFQEAHKLGVVDFIENIGPVSVDRGPELYASCHICFMPTAIEVFSASYAEAMAMSVPIVTSDLDFARSVCQDAANYFHPAKPSDAARAIVEIVEDPELREQLVANGKTRLATLPTPAEKYRMFTEQIASLVQPSPDA